MTKIAWVISCEHASLRVPERLLPLFKSAENRRRLQSHEGYDKGALTYAHLLSKGLKAPLFTGSFSRLVVELNRSLNHPQLFSSITGALSADEKEIILRRIYRPFRDKVFQQIFDLLHKSEEIQVVHISCHTFTPVFHGEERKTKMGILYDPRSKYEKGLANYLKKKLIPVVGRDKLHLNKPYKGISDGHVTHLRRLFSPKRYVGLELEIASDRFDPPHSDVTCHVWVSRLIEAFCSFRNEIESKGKLL